VLRVYPVELAGFDPCFITRQRVAEGMAWDHCAKAARVVCRCARVRAMGGEAAVDLKVLVLVRLFGGGGGGGGGRPVYVETLHEAVQQARDGQARTAPTPPPSPPPYI
jgi:hypothetical protein